ncbi:calphotin isoform X1 [Danio aesculapii]|uniref:calphotin isoform X1 n=1 Tax=Danio aesculapii TaxID=1142201 RepID=UPI0024BF5C61|nr:calphotin isoform X1 [Danio aesculapii]
MPSKRKKNKRRMRRVQAQRRALEEQYTSSGKGTPGVCAVSAPVPERIPVSKTSESPVTVPIPPPVVAPVEVPLAEPVVLELSVTDGIKDKVVKAAEDLEQTLAETLIKETAVIDKDENVTIPVSEVISSIDEPVFIPAKSEIQFEETTPVATETCVVSPPFEAVDTKCEIPADDPVIHLPVPKETVPAAQIEQSGTEKVAEDVPAAEAASEVDGPVVEPVSDAPVEADRLVLEPVIDAAVEVDGPVLEPVIDDAVEVDGPVVQPVVEAEAITVETEPPEVHAVAKVTEDVYPKPEAEEFPVEAAVPTEALVEPEPQQLEQPIPLQEPTLSVESTIDPIAEESVVAEEPVVAVNTTTAEEQIPGTADAPEVLSETLTETIPASEPLPVPVAKEIIHAQDEFMAQVEAETIKDLAVATSRNVDAMNGCLGVTEVAIES